ncbi:MAG: DnaA regulatory inactivator HdaA [Rhizobiaceae bacterium]
MVAPDEEAPRQLPMEFDLTDAYSADDLVVTDVNRAAASLVAGWPDWPSPVVVLAGPTGSGKTHLASIWRARSAARAFEAAAIGGPELPSTGAALVEDVDSGALDERGLFHLINAVRAAGGTLLMTSRGFPSAWPVALADLLSRLKAATTVEIAEPDDALLGAVITKLFADRQLTVEPHVVSFLVHRMDRSLAAAIELVGRIDRMSLERKSRISRALAADVVAAMDSGHGGEDF